MINTFTCLGKVLQFLTLGNFNLGICAFDQLNFEGTEITKQLHHHISCV